jgi:hypothetical protein
MLKTLMGFTAVALTFLLPTASRGQIHNSGATAWQVLYEKDDKHINTKDIAFRLKINQPDSSTHEMTATLIRYDKVSGNKYERRIGKTAEMTLNGMTTKNHGEGNGHKHEHFELGAVYTEDGQLRVISILGYYHTGKLKNTTSSTGITNREDDRLCIRVRERPLFGPTAMLEAPAAKDPASKPEALFKLLRFYGPTPPCDEQPPDEDVLGEVDTSGGEPPYDP